MKKKFPVHLFVPYLGFYAAQAVFGTYLNLYLNDAGFTKTQMGTFTSFSTLMVLLIQPFWGIASDKAKNKVNVVRMLLVFNALTILGFYLSINFYFVLFIDALFCMFYNPTPPLMDNIALEALENEKSSFNFGHIRTGGTIGYALGVLITGQLMHDNYRKMFYMISLLMLFSLLGYTKTPAVKGYPKKTGKTSFKLLLKDKKILAFIMMNIISCLGLVIYYSYYPLYFTEIGGNSSLVGTLMFVTAVSELPFWLITGKIIDKIGYKNTMVLSAVGTGMRWIILFFVTNPILAIIVNISHGMFFVALNYSLVTYINENVPKELRATGQSLNSMIGTICSRVIGGVVIGYLSDLFGVKSMLLISGIASFAGAVIFVCWYNAGDKAGSRLEGSQQL